MVLAVAPRAAGQGTVGLDAEGAVVRLRGRTFGQEVASGDYIGVMALGPSVVAGLPEQGCVFGDVALPELGRGARVWTVPAPAPWSDLGDLKEYVAANQAWLAARGASAFFGAGVELAPGVTVQRSVLGVGAKLLGAGEVTDVIAWPGATFSAPLSRAVVLGSGLVVPFDTAP
jgi:mannose-1-phosphate guanylyltransferase